MRIRQQQVDFCEFGASLIYIEEKSLKLKSKSFFFSFLHFAFNWAMHFPYSYSFLPFHFHPHLLPQFTQENLTFSPS